MNGVPVQEAGGPRHERVRRHQFTSKLQLPRHPEDGIDKGYGAELRAKVPEYNEIEASGRRSGGKARLQYLDIQIPRTALSCPRYDGRNIIGRHDLYTPRCEASGQFSRRAARLECSTIGGAWQSRSDGLIPVPLVFWRILSGRSVTRNRSSFGGYIACVGRHGSKMKETRPCVCPHFPKSL
jgi:hypothetical protein